MELVSDSSSHKDSSSEDGNMITSVNKWKRTPVMVHGAVAEFLSKDIPCQLSQDDVFLTDV